MVLKEIFGTTPAGEEVSKFTLSNDNGMSVVVIEFGAAIQNTIVPDKNGKPVDVTLGYHSLEGYINDKAFLGAAVGRSAGRISPPELEIDGKVHQLEVNNGDNNLHSGSNGFNKRVFKGEIIGENKVKMIATVPHLADSFPGELQAEISYTLTEDNALTIDYNIVSSEKTLINPTNHNYFNLAGHNSGSIKEHVFTVFADYYSVYSPDGLPLSKEPVEGTAYDLRTPTSITTAFAKDDPQIKLFGGFDNGFLPDGEGYRKVSEVCEPSTGIKLETFTSEKALQIYTSNMMSAVERGKDGAKYGYQTAFCLETQNLPNSNHLSWADSSIYDAGEVFESKTSYKFSVV